MNMHFNLLAHLWTLISLLRSHYKQVLKFAEMPQRETRKLYPLCLDFDGITNQRNFPSHNLSLIWIFTACVPWVISFSFILCSISSFNFSNFTDMTTYINAAGVNPRILHVGARFMSSLSFLLFSISHLVIGCHRAGRLSGCPYFPWKLWRIFPS